jgi:serralysin
MYLTGDALFMYGNAKGGDDTLRSGTGGDHLQGDALVSMSDNVRGGDDVLISGVGDDILYGDARSMNDNAVGGDDWVIGGDGDDRLAGDAEQMSASAHGGNDMLWGDDVGAVSGGADTFLFSGAIGQDIVFDFRPDEGDQLELRGYGLTDVGDLDITVAPGSTVIDIGASLGQAANVDTIRLVGFDDPLTNGDFIFT